MRHHLLVLFLSMLTSIPVFAEFKVSSQPIQASIYYPEYQYTATVVSEDNSMLSAEISTKLLKIHPKQGAIVEQNQLIAEFDCRDNKDQYRLLESNVSELQANLNLNQLQLTRLQNLKTKQLASEFAVDELLAQKQTLQAQLASLKTQQRLSQRQITRCSVFSPYKAVIAQIHAGQGQWLATGTPIVSLIKLDNAEVAVKVPVHHSSDKLIKSAKWQDDSIENKHAMQLELLRVSPNIETQSLMRTIWYKAPVDKLIGEQGQVIFTESIPHLSPNVLVLRNGKVGYFTVNGNQAKFNELAGAEIGRPAPLFSFDDNAMLIVDGQQLLQDGALIND